MITSLKEIDPVVANQVYDAMLLGKATGPDAGGEIFERFRLANAGKGIAHDCLDQLECPHGRLSFGFDPIAEVVPKLRLEDGFSPLTFQGRALSGTFPQKKALPHVSVPAPERPGAAARSSGSA